MKQRILDAAVAEIELHGSSFRMDDLAKRLNISKRTLYENFHSKNEIIERILFDKSQDFYNLHKQILEDDSLDVVTKLKNLFYSKIRFVRCNQRGSLSINVCVCTVSIRSGNANIRARLGFVW